MREAVPYFNELLASDEVELGKIEYISSREPAPHSSKLFPAHLKLHSDTAVGILPALRELPQ